MTTDSDGIYHARRARQSLAASSMASDRSARLAHGQLAAAYARRAAPEPGKNEASVVEDASGQGTPFLPDRESIP